MTTPITVVDGTTDGDYIFDTGTNDSVSGLAGDDTIVGSNNGNTTIHGGDGQDIISDFYGQNVIHGDAGDDLIVLGGQGTSYIYGDAGNDVIAGVLGDTVTNIVSGGAGSDTYLLGANTSGHIEIADFASGAGGDVFALDTLLLDASGYAPGTNPFAEGFIRLVQSGGDVLVQFDADGTNPGSDFHTIATLKDVDASALTGDNFEGWSPNSAGNETIVGTTHDDTLSGHGGDDLIFALTGNDSLDGGAGDDYLVSDDGNDTLQGGGGGDVMFGGAGDDYYYVDNAGDFVAEDSTLGIDDGGYDHVAASISYTLTDFVEELDLIGTGNINGTGNSGDNWIFDNAGNNWLSGGDGNDTLVSTAGGIDTLVGGNGEDTYWISNAASVITETNAADWDAVWSSVSYTLGANLEELDLLGTGNINATGNSSVNFLYGNSGNNVLNGMNGNDSLIGNGGNDTLQGGGGGDTMWGGAGDDTYYVDNVGDSVYEYTTPGHDDGGYDKVLSSISYTLPTFVEELNLLGTSNINGTGNAGNNWIFGNAGNNVLMGLNGNDTLVSNGGNDTLIGGNGNDTYWAVNTTTVVTETNTTDWDAVWSSVSYTLGANLEELDLLGTGNINGFGNAEDNYITGNAGNNVLRGFDGNDTLVSANGGIDTLIGGDGDDTYWVSNSNTVIAENNVTDWDAVWSSVSYTLDFNLEELDLIGSANINATGNAGANFLFGNSGNNVLMGLSGNDTLVSTNGGMDTLIGGNGDDTYWINNASTVITETNATDWDAVWSSVSYTLGANLEELDLLGSSNISGTGNGAANFLYGNSGANELSGRDGSDTLVGNGGNDTLTGGAGADSFVFSAASANGRDTVQDFAHGTDQLQFTGSDYGFAAGHSLTSSEFTAGTSAVGTSAQFVWDAASHTLYWDDDGTGSHAAIAIATFGGGATVTVGDFHFS